MAAVDKALDQDPGKNHEFLQTCEKLVKLKENNPRIRLSGTNPLRENLLMSEEETTGLRAPKKSFLELSQYEKLHGPAPVGKIKTIKFRGQLLRGVDVIKEEDVSCHVFIPILSTSLNLTMVFREGDPYICNLEFLGGVVVEWFQTKM